MKKEESGIKAEEIKGEKPGKAAETAEPARKDYFRSKEEMREERDNRERAEHLAAWAPKTKIGKLVKEGKIKDLDYILDNKIKIAEPEVVDLLINTKMELLNIGQSKGKFGGGKRRAW